MSAELRKQASDRCNRNSKKKGGEWTADAPSQASYIFLSFSDAGLSGWKGIGLAVLAVSFSNRPITFDTVYRGGWLWAQPHPHEFSFGRWQDSLNRTCMGLETL